jgi:hypothetical protein
MEISFCDCKKTGRCTRCQGKGIILKKENFDPKKTPEDSQGFKKIEPQRVQRWSRGKFDKK